MEVDLYYVDITRKMKSRSSLISQKQLKETTGVQTLRQVRR